ncbi:unnamed protein product, partial [Prorocentrum cordatum]
MGAALVEAAAMGAAKGGGGRQAVAAAVAAACRCVVASAQRARAGGDGGEELAVRLAAMVPAMLQRIRGAGARRAGALAPRRRRPPRWTTGKRQSTGTRLVH